MHKFSFSSIIESIPPSETLALNAKAQELKNKGHDVLNFTVGEPDAPTFEPIKLAGINAIRNNITKYTPAAGMPKLRLAIASHYINHYGVPSLSAENVMVSNGGKQVLSMLFAILLNPGDEVIVPSPYWTTYPEQIKLALGKPVYAKTDKRFIINSEEIEKNITPKTKAIIINSPNNPTGAIVQEEELLKIISSARKHGILIISDEVYNELFFTKTRPPSLASLSENPFDNIIVASSFSKTYAMTGWRIGYAVAHPDIITKLTALQSHFSSAPCSISQEAAISALEEETETHVEKLRQSLRRRRDLIVEQFAGVKGIALVPPMGAFYAFPEISAELMKKTNGRFCELLLEKERVAVVPGKVFGAFYENYFRLSFAVEEKNIIEGARRIKKILLETA